MRALTAVWMSFVLACCLVAPGPAAAQTTVPMRAIVLDFPASQAEVETWTARNRTRLFGPGARVHFPPGYPLVVSGQQMPELGPVRFAVLAGVFIPLL